MAPEFAKKWVVGSVVALLIAAAGTASSFLFLRDDASQEQAVGRPTETGSQTDGETGSAVTFLKKIEVTPDDTYKYGAFCRVNYVEENDDFFVTFGGSSRIIPFDPEKSQYRAGGAEGGNGYSYKQYTNDFVYTGEDGVVSNTGGDAASVMAEGYYFILTGGRLGWQINKIDPTTWKTVKTIDIEIDPEHEATNDQMLAYANGFLVASSLWSGGNAQGLSDQTKTDPTQGSGTHNRVFTTDLEEVDYFVLTDTQHINGSSLVYVDGVYNFVTSSSYFGNLIVMRYDEDWNYLGTVVTDEFGHWPQGTVYDPETEKFYVAYIDLGTVKDGKLDPNISPNIAIGVYDKEWNPLETVPVTDYFTRTDNTAPGRPSVILQDGTLYVSYDVETFNAATFEENHDWQCQVKAYDINAS